MYELIYQVLVPYGFVDTQDDIFIKSNGIIYLSKLGKNIKYTKEGKFKIGTLYKPNLNKSIILDTKTEYMLEELKQIPLVEYGEEIQYIGLCSAYVYYIELLARRFIVELAFWDPSMQDPDITRGYIRPGSPISYYFYLLL